ncbi:MAG: group III truncated hemoglobin [Calditrichaeota bacterium]|nr:MAG: group III truncated hemoglobin [Calditrichota bacterium]
MTKKDLTSREDIQRLVETFYGRVRRDDRLGPIFNDVAAVDWDKHIPLLVDFWSTIVFSKPAYKGNPMQVHIDLNKKTPLNGDLFEH